MKFLMQFSRILMISLAGELLKMILPLPIPASVYGLILMLICLSTGILKVNQVKEAAVFLIEIMPVMFIPTAVGLVDAWGSLQPVFLKVIITIVVTTVLVMAVTGRITQFVMKKSEGKPNG